jgi:hypothetical protein
MNDDRIEYDVYVDRNVPKNTLFPKKESVRVGTDDRFLKKPHNNHERVDPGIITVDSDGGH